VAVSIQERLRKWLLDGLKNELVGSILAQRINLGMQIQEAEKRLRTVFVAELSGIETQVDIQNQLYGGLGKQLDGLESTTDQLIAWQRISKTELWTAAKQAVDQIAGMRELNDAAQNEEMTSFCPRCGQTPDGDRRLEEARELLMKTGIQAARSDVDFVILAHYWLKKNAL